MHGVVHSNGYGHLLRINGREGGSKSATGLELVRLWDAICEGLLVKYISTEDVSNKSGMELRVLHTAATKMTWYGKFGYHFGRGAFNIPLVRWRKAAEQVHNASLDGIEHDAQALGDIALLAILQRYRAGVPGKLRLRTLGQLLDRMLGLLHNQDEAVLFFQKEALRIAYFVPVKPAAVASSPSKKRKVASLEEEEEEEEKKKLQQGPSTSKQPKSAPIRAPPASLAKKPTVVESPSKKKAKTASASAPASLTKKPVPLPLSTATVSKKKEKKTAAAVKANPVGSDLIGYKIKYYEKAQRTWYVCHISCYNQNTRQHTITFIKQTLKPKKVRLENERYDVMGLDIADDVDDDDDDDDESGGKRQKGNSNNDKKKKKNTKEGEVEEKVYKIAGSKGNNKAIIKEDEGKKPGNNKVPAAPSSNKKQQQQQQKEGSKPSSTNIISFAVSQGRYDPTDKVRRTAKALPLLFPAASTILQPRARTLRKEALDHLFKQVAGEAPAMEWGEEWHVYLGTLLDWGHGLVNGGGEGGGGGKGGKTSTISKAIKVNSKVEELDKDKLHDMGLYPEHWPVPFTAAGVKKANKQYATKMAKGNVVLVEEQGTMGHTKKKENDVVDFEDIEEEEEEEEEEEDVEVRVGTKIKMYIKTKQTYHVAWVVGITATGKHQLEFNNGKKQTTDLAKEKWVLLAAPDADTVAADKKKKAAADKKAPSLPASPTKQTPASPTKQAATPDNNATNNKILPESALKRTFPISQLPPITFSSRSVTWSHERALRGLTLLLSTLRRYPSQWIGRATLREAAGQDGLKDGGLLDYLCRSLENVIVDGLAVHRVMHPQTKTLFYLAENAGRVGIRIEDIPPPGGGGDGEIKKQEKEEKKKQESKGKEPAVDGTTIAKKDNGSGSDDGQMLALQHLQHQTRVSLRRIEAATATAAAAEAEAGPSTQQQQPAISTKFRLVISKNNKNNSNGALQEQKQQKQYLPDSESSIRAKQDEALKFLLKLQKWPWVVLKKRPGRPLTHPSSSLSLAAAAAGTHKNILVPPPPTAPQPWQDPPPQPRWAVLLPGVLPPSTDGTIQGICKELIKDQVMRDLAHLYFTVLPGKTFGPRPAPLTKAKQNKRDRAAASNSGGGSEKQLPAGLQKLQEHVQVLKDVKHFIKEFPSGVHPENAPHRPPPRIMQVVCKLQMPKMASFGGHGHGSGLIGQQQQYRAGGVVSRSLSHHTRLPRAIEPPPELITVGPVKSTTVGDMKAAAARAFSETYVAFEGMEVTTIEAGVQKQQLQQGGSGTADKTLLTTVLFISHHHYGINIGSQGEAGAVPKKPQLPVVVVGGVQGLPTNAWTSRAGGPEDWVVHCTCGTQDDDGEAMFICDKCHTWMHLRCQGYGTGDNDNGPGSGENWVCTMCAKRSRVYK